MNVQGQIPGVFGDNFDSGDFDVGDFENIQGREPELASALFGHVFEERTFAAENGAGFRASHNFAKGVEASNFGATQRFDTPLNTRNGPTQVFTYKRGGFLGFGGTVTRQFSIPTDRRGDPR